MIAPAGLTPLLCSGLTLVPEPLPGVILSLWTGLYFINMLHIIIGTHRSVFKMFIHMVLPNIIC